MSAKTNGAPEVVGAELRMVYRKREVLDVPEVVLPAGKTYALLGASGAGKSTLLRVLGMLERPTSGTVTFDSETLDAGRLSTRRGIAAVFQKPHLMRGTVEDNVGYGLQLRGVPAKERGRRVQAQLERMGIPGWEKRSALTLSGGEAQRVALARALVLEPDLLLLDEPLSYLDPLLRRQLTVEFAELLASEHLTTLYVTHDQDEAVQVADRIGIMREGRLVAEGTPDDVLTLPNDEWVAAFLDTQMPEHGRVAESADGTMHVTCRGGVTIAAKGALPSGTDCVVGIRPEDVTVLPAESDEQRPEFNRLAAVVTDVRPSGSSVSVSLDASGLDVGASVSRSSARILGLEAGMHVIVEFPPAVVVVRANPSPTAEGDGAR